jgi:protein YIPF6
VTNRLASPVAPLLLVLLYFYPDIQSTVRAELRDWDLWGPLFICMSLAVMLSLKAHEEASLVFSVIFVIMWVGAAVVTINGQLLGGRLSFFQSVCLLGYCVFPILISACACFAFNSFVPRELAVVLRFVAVVVALFWAIFGTPNRVPYHENISRVVVLN